MKQGFEFVDNRPVAIAQRKLQEMANNNPRNMQMKAFQEMPYNSAPAASLGQHEPAEPLQRKRSANSVSDQEIAKTKPAVERDLRNRDTMENDYNESLVSGKKIRDEGLKWYNGTDYSVGSTPDGFSDLGYKHDWAIDEDDHEITVGTGRGSFTPNGEECDSISEDDDYFYINIIDTETGAITADNNWRETDNEANETELGTAPRNSDMLWFHYEFALSKANKQAPAGGPKKITRSSISNQRTVDTILKCTEGAKVSLGGSHTFDDPFDNDTWAVLGTPNGNSAVWLLIQHGTGAGMADIEKVTASKESEDSAMDLTIYYIAAGE